MAAYESVSFKTRKEENHFLQGLAHNESLGEESTHEKRIARYYLLYGKSREFLGTTVVQKGMDVDDAFPLFHSANFDESHLSYLSQMIRRGASLVAECRYDNEMAILAYTLGDENYWYGRESTLKYFGIEFKVGQE